MIVIVVFEHIAKRTRKGLGRFRSFAGRLQVVCRSFAGRLQVVCRTFAAGFRSIQLVSGRFSWFQVVSAGFSSFQLVSAGFSSFQLVLTFINYGSATDDHPVSIPNIKQWRYRKCLSTEILLVHLTEKW